MPSQPNAPSAGEDNVFLLTCVRTLTCSLPGLQRRCRGPPPMIRWVVTARRHQRVLPTPLAWRCTTPQPMAAARLCAPWRAACRRCTRLTAAACSTTASRHRIWMAATALAACTQALVSSSTCLHMLSAMRAQTDTCCPCCLNTCGRCAASPPVRARSQPAGRLQQLQNKQSATYLGKW